MKCTEEEKREKVEAFKRVKDKFSFQRRKIMYRAYVRLNEYNIPNDCK
jgi:hypothetical protein